MGDLGRMVDMRDLDRGPENEEQSAENSQGHPPPGSSALFGLQIVHSLNDSVTFFDQAIVLGRREQTNPALAGLRELDERLTY